MKKLVILIALLGAHGLTHADLAGDLRSLRNTVTEMTQTGKELGAISNQPNQLSVQNQANQSITNELKSGDILLGKLGKTKLLSDSNRKSKNLVQLSKSDEMIFMGEEKDGFYRVTANAGEGWVDKLLVQKAN